MNASAQPSMPFSDDAEKGLLSCFLQNPTDLISDAMMSLDVDAFYHPANRLIYEVLREFNNAGRPIDLVSLSHYLIDKGLMERIGGPATLADLYSFVPTPAHYGYYKSILLDKHLLRRIINTCTDAIQAAYSHTPSEPANNALNTFEQAVIEIRESHSDGGERTWKQVVMSAEDRYEQAILNDGALPGVSTGYRRLDAATGGMRPGQVWTIGGGTSDGKSAFMQNIIASLGRRRVPTCVYTLEMTDDENADRFFSMESCVPGDEFLYGLSNRESQTACMRASQELKQWPLHVRDVSGIKLSALRADMRRQARRHNVRVFALDYLQLVTPDQRGQSREREVAEISAALKADAKLLKATIINLSQLNDDGKLRESRAVGMDSDVIAMLEVPKDNNDVPIEEKRELVLAKVRGGKRGVVIDYDFHGPTYRFIEC